MGYRIFAHALRLVFGNLGDALRTSGILYLLSSGSGIAVTNLVPSDGSPLRAGLALIVLVINLVIGIWIAVAWHRYVLLDERPDTVVPPINGQRMLAYFGYSVLLALVGAGVGLGIGVLIGLFAALHAPPVLTIPVLIVAGLLFFVASYRWSVILPASSVEKSIGLRQAWEATKGTTWTLLAVAVLSFLFFFVLLLPGAFLVYAHLTLLGEIWNAIWSWVVIMVSVAIITTIYGHYVEGRTIR